MRDYSYSELMAMQEEATKRVHEMQERARKTAERAQREISGVPPKNTDYSSQDSGGASRKSVVNQTENGVTVTPPREAGELNTIESPTNASRAEAHADDVSATKQIYPKPHPPRHIPMPSGISQSDISPLNGDTNSVREKHEHSDGKEHNKHNDSKHNNKNTVCAACNEDCPFKSLYNSPLSKLLNKGKSADQSLLLALLLLIGSDSGDELMMLALLYMMG